jgi:hypothetical protein
VLGLNWDRKTWPPDLQWHEDNEARDVIIYCGSDDFLTDDGEEWLEPESGQIFDYHGTKVGEDKWNICGNTEYALSMTRSEETFDLVWLCAKLLDPHPSLPGEANIAERGTYEALHQNGKLDYKVFFNESKRRVLSHQLLHEMFHIAQNTYSQYCFSSSTRYMLINNHCSDSVERILWMV